MQNTVKSIRVILTNEKGQILLLKRANAVHENGKWAIPGGKIEENESEESTCVKEIKEETSLDITDLRYLFSLNSPPIDNQKGNYFAKYFTASFSGKVKINEESSEYKWTNSDEIDKMELAFNQKEGIKRYLAEFR